MCYSAKTTTLIKSLSRRQGEFNGNIMTHSGRCTKEKEKLHCRRSIGHTQQTHKCTKNYF